MALCLKTQAAVPFVGSWSDNPIIHGVICVLTGVTATATLRIVGPGGIAMRILSNFNDSLNLLAGVLIMLVTAAASGQEVENVPVNIFGDGNPNNGMEDSREQLMGRVADQPMSVGAVMCDGQIRGSAMVVDTRDLDPGLKGVVLASAAHVLYNLETGKRFRRCEFHFMALSELQGYRAKIDLKKTRLGGFDPKRDTTKLEFGEGDWAYLYVPKPWKKFNPNEAVSLREFSSLQAESYRQTGGEFRLVAFDSSTGAIMVSRDCTVIESGKGDLGGGGWKGQLLDDCDSIGGASGGGIIAMLNGQHYLVGIRSGSHWSRQLFPVSEFPIGPPDGSRWDRYANTNFGRAIDARLLTELELFLEEIKKGIFLF